MDIDEAKKKITKEFIDKYYEWLSDRNNFELSDREYGKKYGWGRDADIQKDTQKAIRWFQGHIFSGRYIQDWVNNGYEKSVIYALHQEGFLSYDYDSSWRARQLGQTDFYYLNQENAKKIYRDLKKGN